VGFQIIADSLSMLQKSNGNESPVIINDQVNVDGSVGGKEVIIKVPVLYD
jgi:hypothetical protein